MKKTNHLFYTLVFIGSGIALLSLILYNSPLNMSSSRDVFSLSQTELKELSDLSDGGDRNASFRLSEYYLMSQLDERTGYRYYEKATIQGHERARKIVQGMIDTYGFEGYKQIFGLDDQQVELRLKELITFSGTNKTNQ